jgi:hypothetical protein
MNKTKVFILSMVIGLLAFGASSVSASGYPFFVLDQSLGSQVVVVGKFSTQYTQAEAQNLTSKVVALVQDTLGSSGSTVIFTPNQLESWGLGDADALNSAIKSNYKQWGIDLYIFVDIKQVSQYAAGFGPNARIDVYVADMADLVNVNADYLYALSIELPIMYADLLP